MKKKTFIIAEIGINHNGSFKLAKKLIDASVECGADAVKFQTFNTESEMNKHTGKLNYQKKDINKNISLFDYTKKLELDENELDELMKYAKKRNIIFFSSPSDIYSVKLLIKKKQKIWKIASNLITDYPLLKIVAKLNQKIILSTGMSTIKEINKTLVLLNKYGTKNEKITLMQCTTDYPTKINDLNLNVLTTFQNKFGIKVGLSDHSESLIAPSLAVALGSSVIEKHITLNKKMNGPDHKASLSVNEFYKMIKNIRNTEKMLGSHSKKPSKSELKNIPQTRKSIFVFQNIQKGEIIKEKHLTTMRPGTGVNPMKWNLVIGSKARKNFKKGQILEV